MHRSGTSALAGLVSALYGLPAGRLAVDSNPTGQWERPELRPALELMLAWNRCTWAHPPPEGLDLTLPTPLRAYADRVFDRHGGHRSFLWKDPRLCLTIDHWLDRPQGEARVLTLNRDPVEVARSLARRNGWPVERGLALWERTARNAVVRLGGREVYALHHRDLVADPGAVADDLARWLGPYRPRPGADAVARAAATVAPPTPTHREWADQTAAPGGAGGALTEAQAALADRLDRAGGPARLDLAGLGPESPTTDPLLGSPSAMELLRRTGRAARALPRRHRLEVAGPDGSSHGGR